jgi:hypothetical protein
LALQETFWHRAFPTAVGALIGGLVALASLILKEQFDRRRGIQSWYEQTYITEGIDRLIVYLAAVEDILPYVGREKSALPNLIELYPRDAVERFRILFPSSPIFWISLMPDLCRYHSSRLRNTPDVDLKGVHKTQNLARILKEEFTALEKGLLGTRVTRKVQVHTIRDKKEIRPLIARLEQRVKDIESS